MNGFVSACSSSPSLVTTVTWRLSRSVSRARMLLYCNSDRIGCLAGVRRACRLRYGKLSLLPFIRAKIGTEMNVALIGTFSTSVPMTSDTSCTLGSKYLPRPNVRRRSFASLTHFEATAASSSYKPWSLSTTFSKSSKDIEFCSRW